MLAVQSPGVGPGEWAAGIAPAPHRPTEGKGDASPSGEHLPRRRSPAEGTRDGGELRGCVRRPSPRSLYRPAAAVRPRAESAAAGACSAVRKVRRRGWDRLYAGRDFIMQGRGGGGGVGRRAAPLHAAAAP